MTPYNPKNECKLMILYLLKNVSFPLNHENIGNFFLDKYTTYIQFQEIIAELTDTKLIEEHKTKTSICYKATDDGLEALNSFINDIAENHKKEIDQYIIDNKIKLKEESIISSNFTDGEANNYQISLQIAENPDEKFKILIDVPTADVASTMCENWKVKAKNIYAYVIKQLL